MSETRSAEVQIYGVEELQAFMRDLESKDGELVKEMRASVKKAINKTVKPYIYQIAREEYTASGKTWKSASESKVKKADSVYGHVLHVRSNRIPVYGFRLSPKKVQDQKGKRVTGKITDPKTGEEKRAKGPKRIKGPKVQIRREADRKMMGGVFVAKMSSGHIGLFHRKKGVPSKSNPKKEKIEELISISMKEMLQKQMKIPREDKLGITAIREDLNNRIRENVKAAQEKYKAKMAQEAAQ